MNERKILIEVTPEEYEKIKNGALDSTATLSDLDLLNVLLKKAKPTEWVEIRDPVFGKICNKQIITISNGGTKAEIALSLEGVRH